MRSRQPVQRKRRNQAMHPPYVLPTGARRLRLPETAHVGRASATGRSRLYSEVLRQAIPQGKASGESDQPPCLPGISVEAQGPLRSGRKTCPQPWRCSLDHPALQTNAYASRVHQEWAYQPTRRSKPANPGPRENGPVSSGSLARRQSPQKHHQNPSSSRQVRQSSSQILKPSRASPKETDVTV
jgi:hypothetical protein